MNIVLRNKRARLVSLNPDEQSAFYQAHITGDDALKQRYHNQYYPQTLAILSKHVDYLNTELEELSEFSWKKDINRHPRLPLLLRHNDFVRSTFELVQQNLDPVSA
ncbi:hypothetical protein ACHAW6_006099 [Cyclotella cf. meneghiniana]